jgi:hypothetical protein
MTGAKKHLLAMSALILLGSVASAHAQSVQIAAKTTTTVDTLNTRSDFNPQTAQFAPLDGKKTLQFDATKGRWGLKLDLDQPTTRDMELQDVRAGAFFKLTPSLRVGGAVSLGDQNAKALIRKNEPPQAAPRVRLETAFKF